MLTSPTNSRVKALVRLRDRRERDRTGLTIVDGVREVDRAREAGAAIVEAFVGPAADGSAEARAVVERLAAAGTPLVSVAVSVASRIGFGDRDEGIVAVVRIPPLDLGRLSFGEPPLIVVVEGIEKPGNLGAIIRSADAAGADAVIVADARTDPYNPNAIRASLGTIFAVRVAAAASTEVLAWLRARGIRPIAARPDAPVAYTVSDFLGPTALVLGTEASGLSATWDASDIAAVSLPMHGLADSLNVSVAAAILLYEARRQRTAAPGT